MTTETWVHGNAFVPRLYGPDQLDNVEGQAWTDQQGLREGHVAKFVLRDERTNWFHAAIPAVGQQQLKDVKVEFWSTFANLTSAWVHSGRNGLFNISPPGFTSLPGEEFSIMTLSNINQQASRGLCVSVAFTTVGPGLGPGQIRFYGAGAVFD